MKEQQFNSDIFQSEIKTNHLILRNMILDDYKDLHDIRFHPEVLKHIKREIVEDKSEFKSFITDRLKDIRNGNVCFWGISTHDDPKLIGTICLWNFNSAKTIAEIGYELHPDHHRKGFMSEAMTAVLNFGFSELNLKTIEAFTNKHNKPSKTLLKKFNFKHEVYRTDEGFPDNIIYTKHYA